MRRVVCGVAGALLLATSGFAAAPEGRFISQDELRLEAAENTDLAEYLDRNGTPEVAEVRVLADRPPWDDHEVTLYYLGERHEISFARALTLGKADISVIRYERELTDADVDALRSMAADTAGGGDVAMAERADDVDWATATAAGTALEGGMPTTPAERAEAAADRAEIAAGRVELAADRTEKAATRAETAFDRLATSTTRSRR
jgi:hypothetical protein